MKIGLALPQRGDNITPGAVKTFAQEAEAHGFDCLWVHERLFNPLADPRIGGLSNDLSPFELLSFTAAATDTIRLGTSVIIVGYYRPLMLAKKAASLDILSGGRLTLGIGLGLNKQEYIQSDVDFHTRGRRSADFIKALIACWRDDPVEYKGEFFNIPPSATAPKPVQRDADGNPYIPIVGGFSSAPGQRRTAELCDAWQSAGRDLDTAIELHREANRAAQEDFGRPPLKLIWRCWVIPPGFDRKVPEQTGDRVVSFFDGTIDEICDRVREARDAGVDELICDTNWFGGDGKEDHWEKQPALLAKMVDAAHG